MPPFVGRRREARLLRAELEAGRNVVLTGPYGIGRTTLVSYLARTMVEGWRFVWLDGGRTPGQLYGDVAAALYSVTRAGRRERLPYRRARHWIATRAPVDPRAHALVLDDLASVSAPKLDFLRRLVRAGRYRFVAIAESFMPVLELAQIRSVLGAASLTRLGPLSLRDGERFFAECRGAFGLHWPSGDIHGFALAARGFPLGMRDRLTRELERADLAPPSTSPVRQTALERT